MYTKKQKKIASVLCVTFILFILLSAAFLVKEANHDCTGENCPICIEMEQVGNTLRNLGSSLFVCMVACSFAINFFFVLGEVCADGLCATLVSQKVRMNN